MKTVVPAKSLQKGCVAKLAAKLRTRPKPGTNNFRTPGSGENRVDPNPRMGVSSMISHAEALLPCKDGIRGIDTCILVHNDIDACNASEG